MVNFRYLNVVHLLLSTARCAQMPITPEMSNMCPTASSTSFRPDVAEAPYTVADNVVSRKSHYAHEAKKSEYSQTMELYRRVMDDKARKATHSNTVKMM